MRSFACVQTVPSGSTFDLFAGDLLLFDGLGFKTVTPYRAVDGKRYALALRPAGMTQAKPLSSNTENLKDGGFYTAIAMPGDGHGPSLRVVNDHLDSPASGKARLRIVHAGGDAGTVDVHASGTESALFDDLAYETVTEYKDVAPMNGRLEVISSAGSIPVADGGDGASRSRSLLHARDRQQRGRGNESRGLSDRGRVIPVSQRARIIIGVLVASVVIAAIGIGLSLRTLEPRMHDWVTSHLSRSLESEVALGAVRLNWLPLRLRAENLTVRHHGRTDIPPLIVVSSFTVDLSPMDLWSSTVDRVRVDGLEINIPPRDPETGRRPLPRTSSGDPSEADNSGGLIIRHLLATNARLSIVPRDSNKNAKVWDVYELDMKNLRANEPATFTASLINPIPYGKIESSGQFGPWQSDEPGTSALRGEYTFEADLGTIQGLGGALSAIGTMGGTLEQIATTGQTKTPDFRLTELDGESLPLQTSYDAIVDGTKGDVELKRVDITLGRSRLLARGVVQGTKGIKGKRVVVNVSSKSANLGELLRFVSKGHQPPAEGTLIIDAALDLPQGTQKVLERVSLEGSVTADSVRFTKDSVQDKIDELSRKAQGRPSDASIDRRRVKHGDQVFAA